jgi:hypothetical protein
MSQSPECSGGMQLWPLSFVASGFSGMASSRRIGERLYASTTQKLKIEN